MGKPPRIHYEGAVYHVTARGIRGSDIFLDEADKAFFYKLLAKGKDRFKVSILAYCLMTNHLHLLLQVGAVRLERFMHWVLSQYARYFNWKYRLKGYVFEDRYYPRLVRTNEYLATVIRYIHDNPVGVIVERARDYKWSSYRGMRDRTDVLLDFAALDALICVEDVVDPAPLLRFHQDSWYISTSLVFDEPRVIPDLGMLSLEVAGHLGPDLRGPSRTRVIAALRKEFCRVAFERGATQAEIARFLNRTEGYVSQVNN